MVHPDRVVDAAGLAKLPLIDPVYPLTEGLHPNQLRKAIDVALQRVPDLPEWQDAAWLKRNAFPSFAEALRSVHRPAEPADAGAAKRGLVAARLRRTSCRPARARAAARAICASARAAAAPPRAACAHGSLPRCPIR